MIFGSQGQADTITPASFRISLPSWSRSS